MIECPSCRKWVDSLHPCPKCFCNYPTMYDAYYGNKNKDGEFIGIVQNVIVCEEHLEQHTNELKLRGEAAERINCYFCRGGQ